MDSEDRQELAGQLVWLAGEGDTEGARAIVASAPELLNRVCAFGETALGYWAIKQRADAVTLLLDLGADVNATNNVGGTPLMACAGLGDLDMVKLLLERGADPDYADHLGDCTLIRALDAGDAEMAALLLKSNANPNIRHPLGARAPDMFADLRVDARSREVVAPKFTEQEQALSEELTRLAGALDQDAAIAMIAQYPGILGWGHLWGETPLHYWVVENRLDAVKMLVELGGDVNSVDDSGCPPLVTCCQMQYLEMARFLLDSGADPNACDEHENAIFHVLDKHDADMVKLLLDKGANPNVRDYCGDWALFEAIYNDDYAIARLLLEHGADPDVDDHEGDRLHHLVFSEMEIDALKYCRLLAEHGADLLRFGASQKHPIFLAIENGDREAVRFFLDAGIAPTTKDTYGETVASRLRSAGIFEDFDEIHQ